MLHATYGSSTAGRTMACPGWVALSEGIPNKESSFAIDGSITHAMLECKGLDDSYSFQSQIGEHIEGGVVAQSHVDKAEECWRLAQELFTEHGISEFEPEVRVKMPGVDDMFGTLDLIASSKDRGFLIDYKCGEGVMVEAVGNAQLLFSAALGLRESAGQDLLTPHENFTGVIIQPNDRGDSVKTWDFTLADVQAFEKEYLAAVASSRKPGAKVKTGSHCRFCPAAATCPEKTGAALRAKLLDPKKLETLAESMALASELKSWIKTVESAALDQLEAGAKVEGFKLVRKRAIRSWYAEDEAIEILGAKLGGVHNVTAPLKLLPPGAIEKLASALDVVLDLEPLTSRHSSGNTLASSDDRRTAVVSAEGLRASLNSIK